MCIWRKVNKLIGPSPKMAASFGSQTHPQPSNSRNVPRHQKWSNGAAPGATFQALLDYRTQ